MDDSIELFTSFISTLNLRTLRMCNNQFGYKGIIMSRIHERNISDLSFITASHIEELYLDNNRIGNAGLHHLLTLLMNNQCLKRLSIRNNDIGDTGALLLVDFLRRISEFLHIEHNSSLEVVDMRNNSLFKPESSKAVQTLSDSPRVLFTYPQ